MIGADRYLETFRQEADELLGEIEAVILLIEENPADDDAINRLFRAVHTLKGSGGMFGLTDIARFSHGLESVLDKVREKQLAVTRELIDLTLAYRDQVSLMLHASEGDAATDMDSVMEIERRLKALCPEPEKAIPSPVKSPASTEPFGAPRITYRIRFAPQQSLFVGGTEPALLLDELRGLGECTVIAHFDDVPALDAADPEACHLTWDIILTTPAGLDAIRDIFVFVDDISRIDIDDISSEALVDPDAQQLRLGDILLQRGDISPEDLHSHLGRQRRLGELLVESGKISSAKVVSALSEQQSVAKQQGAAKNDSVRVPADKLDALINLLGELVTNQARLSQIARNSGDMILAAPVEEADRLTDELRDIVLNIRMMPIGTTFSRFKRLVRDLSGELAKQIDLVTEGAETELDKTVIDRLGDPLVHLIRNSIDHGIEHPDERLRAGKPVKGTITLKAAHKGASVVISIIDDGAGLDAPTILRKAKERGLVATDAKLAEQDIFALIFAPGFSTAKNVTDLSGRGVGMDVVRREIESLRGSIDLQSEQGQGTRIDLSLPLTLAIIEGLLVHVGQDRYVIPLSAIEECLELTADRFATSTERNVISVRGAPVPLVRLREIFSMFDPRPPLEQAVVVNVGEFRVGLVVDQVIGNHQTVIKSLGRIFRKADCISGATIMGDGNVALILDLAGIIRCAKSDEAAFLNQGRLMTA
jgi:two-component system chemotaxis sensor kinase CheA